MGVSRIHPPQNHCINVFNHLWATTATAAEPPQRTAAFNDFNNLQDTAANRRISLIMRPLKL
jgi:hypothetical protein